MKFKSIFILIVLLLLGSFYLYKQVVLRVKTTPLVSVVMPVYNRENFVERAIQSVLNQTYKNFEFIIVDDGSTDLTYQVLLKYAQKDNRIKVFKLEKNQGISKARNEALKHVQGKYFTTIDSDDMAYPSWLQKGVAFMEQNEDVVISFPKADYYDESIGALNEDFPQNNKIRHLIYRSIANIGAFYRYDFLKKYNIYYNKNYVSGEDYDFIMQFIMNGGKISVIDSKETLMLYRWHHKNTEDYYTQGKQNEKKIQKKVYQDTSINLLERNSYCDLFKAFIKKYPNSFDFKTKVLGYMEFCLLIF